jgi:hypothetical protein
MISQRRFDRMFSGQTDTAKKVYNIVPIQEAWGAAKIASELKRQGVNLNFPVVMGCLDTLIRAGLVKEPLKGDFQREAIKPEPVKEQNKEPEMNRSNANATATAAPSVVTKVQKDPLDILGGLAQRAALLSNTLKELASDISNAAVEIQEQLEANDEQVKKVKQLQTLMKELGMVQQ